MNKSAILNSCRFVSLVIQRADKFDLTKTEAIVMIGVNSLEDATYDEIGRVTATSTHTLRSTSTSPLNRLGDKDLVTCDLKRNAKKKDVKVFTLTEQGEMVLHFLITGENREVAEGA